MADLLAERVSGPLGLTATGFLSWGLHVGVQPDQGRWGWDGGSGTSAWADPRRELVAVLLTARGTGPEDAPTDFWHAVHEACGTGASS